MILFLVDLISWFLWTVADFTLFVLMLPFRLLKYLLKGGGGR